MKEILNMATLFVALLFMSIQSSIQAEGGQNALNAQLEADVDVFIDNRLVFKCKTTSQAIQVQWFRSVNNVEHIVVVQDFAENRCFSSHQPDHLECYCNSTSLYTCAIKAVNESNDGDIWRCSAVIDGFTHYSNSYNINLLVILTTLTLLPRPVSAVSYPIYNATSTFTCITSQSRPAASIHWFEDGVNITEKSSYEYSLYVATSRVNYTPKTRNNTKLSCVATYVYKNITKHVLNGTDLQIQYPVSKPVVVMNDKIVSETVSIREHVIVEFRCSAAGYPPPSYRWTYPGGNATGSVMKLQFDRSSIAQSITCAATNAYYSLNGSTGTQSTTDMTSLKMTVSYPPSFKHFVNKADGYTFTDINITLVKGDDITISCEWDANPQATVFWNGQQMNSSTLAVTNIQQDTTWTCLAFNIILVGNGLETQVPTKQTLSVSVLYGPDHPTVRYSVLPELSNTRTVPANGTISLIESSSVQLTCSANSNPTSTYKWGPAYNNAVRDIANVSRDADVTFTCTAENVMVTSLRGNVMGRTNTTVRFYILYGPEHIVAKYNNITHIDLVVTVTEGSSFEISCSAKSNPASSISWYGPGTHVGNVLSISNASRDRNKNITCTAMNAMVDSLGNRESKSAQLTVILDVQYPPTVQQIANQTVLLNTSFTMVCNLTSVGNPPETNYTWLRNGSNTAVGTMQTLTINHVRLTDEGEYRCNATNIMQPIGSEVVSGFSETAFYINVQYKAHILAFEANAYNIQIMVDQDESIQLVCNAFGDPVPLIRIVNATRGIDSLLIEQEAHTAKYNIHQTRCEYDGGTYKCLAYNKYNTEQHENIIAVVVNCSPRASPFSPPITELYRAPNDSAVFTFTIMAYPEPKSSDFSWYRRLDDEWKDVPIDSNNFRINISDDKLQTQLVILRVQVEDYTEYMVNITNKLGSVAEVFTLHAQSIPEVPKGLLIDRVGKTDIIITWVPGFNGGQDQNFTIRYKEDDIEIWRDIYIADSIEIHTCTIGGLKPGTKYRFKMLAENKSGKSDWTAEIMETTHMDAVEKGSAAPVIGGAIGAAACVGILVAVIIVIWRYRTRALQQSDATKILTRRSINHAKGTYENIGMVTPHQEKKTNKHGMASSRPGTNLRSSCEHSHKLAPDLNKNNIQNFENNAEKSAPINDNIQRLQKSAGKSALLTYNVRSSKKHETVTTDLPCSPIATPSKDNVSLQRRDSCSIEHDPTYDNLYKTKKQFKSRTISVQDLRETVVRDKENKTDVFTEYSALTVACEKIKYSTNGAMKQANTSKNRYKNMYPYDKNKVTLSVIGNDIDTDYINASFIDAYSSQKKYIAAQGPLAGTRADLWRMIWEKNVRVVVMVTNLVEESKRKCFQYWPTDAENDCQYGDFTIHLLAEETYADFVIRMLRCSQMGSSKTVTHLHFTSWPDKDVPDTALSLMQFWRKVCSVEKPVDSPWIVHCSAGVGRTGTFIALDYLYEQGVSEKQINVFDAVLLLREQRINMVQTKNQYLYLHEVLCEALCPVGEVQSNKAYLDNKRTSDYLNQEYKTICQSQIPDREEETLDGDYIKVLDGEKPENMNKNADPCVVPDDKYRPVLNVAINTKGHTDYINAVYISTFQEGDRLILTQSAKKSSDIDFVRLLHDHYVRTVVTLCDQVEPYLPESGESIVIGPFTASSISCAQKQHFQEYVVRFKHIGEHESFDVRVFRFTKWSKQFDLCKTNELLSLLTDVQERASTEGPVGIQCSDGYSRSGLVAVLWCLMERSKRDGEVAVAETVRMIRRRREQVITNESQYRLCHEFMNEYVEGCLVYANT